MKRVLILAMIIMTTSSYAQEQVLEVTAADQEIIALELEKEAQKTKHDKKTKRALLKLSEFFYKSGKALEVEYKKLDDCHGNCDQKTKGEVVLSNIGRRLGRGSAWVTTKTSKPFLNATGFLTGLLEKKEKNQDIIALYKFFLNHSEEFDSLYLTAQTPKDMINLMLGKVEEIIEAKSRVIQVDTLKALGVEKSITGDMNHFELTDEEISKIDMKKLNVDLINNHSEYAELRGFIGDIKNEQLLEIITLGRFKEEITSKIYDSISDNYKMATPKIYEGVLTIAGQVIAPRIALNVVSRTLGGLYALPVVAADLGTGISTAICLDGETKEKLKSDNDLAVFCSYVINHSGMELMKSRAKGYVAGKSARVKLDERRTQREILRSRSVH